MKTHHVLPAQSSLNQYVGETDFMDCYSVKSSLGVRQAAEEIVNFPEWVEALMLLRKLVTLPFGLKNGAQAHVNNIGIFPIELETENEIVAGFDDKHLDFRVWIAALEGRVYMATWVRTHNIGGAMYLRLIMPFHILICKNALRRLSA